MSHPELAIAGFYDHEQETERRTSDWGGDDLFTAAPPRRRRFERGAHPVRLRDEPHAPVVAAHPEPRVADPYAEPVPAGRRTVTITGRPDPLPVVRRPARTIDERIAHRPERIASWTCSLGALSILLAILTAQ